ncbi:MAG: hypothetical protein KIS76_03195 [Pyrinomonadaceae bacterium]|nr:hypothetical protein [Pyrinomonadaceae bacterium]
MKLKIALSLLLVSTFTLTAVSQQNDKPGLRPRVIEPDEATTKVVVVTDATKNIPATPKPTPYRVPEPVKQADEASVQPNTGGASRMSLGQIKAKIEEAKREMQSRPILTASVDSISLVEVVKLAFYDWDEQHIDFVIVPKEMFLSRSKDLVTISSKGKGITVRTIRGNGVNTPVMIFDQKNYAHLPLLVQYPRENNGILQNVAFYVSTHPGIVTPEVVNAGKLYVRNTIDIARENLRKKGLYISPQVADMAERLAVVEHIDHWRFRNEYHPNIFNDVFALFALNEGDTYKYSVSSAGAGGMVQMIPSTYRMMRSRYPQVGLMPDFVEGMRNHVNASEAMLLYIQMTWNDLIASETVNEALRAKIATPTELMSAGYNSNPARLPGYIKRGGAGWKTLIPRETQIYLEINESFDKYFPLVERTK